MGNRIDFTPSVAMVLSIAMSAYEQYYKTLHVPFTDYMKDMYMSHLLCEYLHSDLENAKDYSDDLVFDYLQRLNGKKIDPASYLELAGSNDARPDGAQK